jgi:murein DD-endopeptidase MepM/ murein hydrolase activator NlpD
VTRAERLKNRDARAVYARFKRCGLALVLVALASVGCKSRTRNPYESASPEIASQWKQVRVPLPSGTHFYLSQGAFGRSSHSQKGIEYRWDFDVPYGTPVVAVGSGTVTVVREPHEGGGCDPKYSEVPNSILIRHADDTLAQYVHIEPHVVVGQVIREGDVIAVTAMNGFICTPQLDFLIYRSEKTLYDSPNRESLPLRFTGLPKERASEGLSGVVP